MPGIEELIGVSVGGTILITAICTCLSVAVAVGATIWAIRYSRRARGGDKVIREQGIPATATILSIWDTGIRLGAREDVQVGFKLQVTPPGGQPYEADAKAVIPMINMASFQPGATVKVKIHPADPSKVELDIYRR